MKKITKVLAILMALTLMVSFTACGKNKKTGSGKGSSVVSADADFFGKYVFAGSDAAHESIIVLGEDGSFTFTFSHLSSYVGYGQYTLKDDVLTLKTDDGQYHYTFKVVDGTLVLDGKNSSKETWNGEFKDGSVFE